MGLLVIHPGLSTTVQDRGRPGYREFGVPEGGAFDRSLAGAGECPARQRPGRRGARTDA